MGLETPTVGLQVQPLGSAHSTYNPQAATAAMIEAFRNGQISTADIIERSTKMPALRQQVAEATDPALIAARKNAALQNSEQETIKSQADAFNLKSAQDLAKIPPTVLAKAKELAQHGALDPNFSPAAYDDNQRAVIEARWNDLQQWKNEAESAAALSKQVEAKEGFDPRTGQPVPIVASGKIVQRQALESIKKYEANYGTPTSFNNWLKDGKPKVHRDLFSAPDSKAVVTPSGNTVGIPTGAPTGAAASSLAVELPPGTSNLTVTAKDEPRTANLPEPGYAGLPPASTKQNTEKQSSAQYFVTRAKETNAKLDELAKKNFDPASAKTYLQGALIGPAAILKEQAVKQYDTAKEAWLQGLLRMESGAAISNKEKGWYDSVFFPVVGDGPEVQAQKAELRHAMERTALQVAANDPLGEKALEEYDHRSDENHKIWLKSQATQKANEPAKNAPRVNFRGTQAPLRTFGTRTAIYTGQRTNSPALLPVAPNK